MNTQNDTSNMHEMDRQALKAYAGFAAFVYGSALIYCYITNHLMEMGIVTGVILGLGILIGNIYKSL